MKEFSIPSQLCIYKDKKNVKNEPESHMLSWVYSVLQAHNFFEHVDLDVLISCILMALDIHNWWV